MNGDYEDALMRLLAGEGGYLHLESDVAKAELLKELDSSNPNTTVYRDFAAATVRLNPERLDAWEEGEEAPAPLDDAEEPEEVPLPSEEEEILSGSGNETRAEVSIVDLAPSAEPELGKVDEAHAPPEPGVETWSSDQEEPDEGPALEDLVGQDVEAPAVIPPEETQTHGGPVASTEEVQHCRSCDEVLPAREGLNFCPYCGTDQRLVPCGSCGEELEPHWRFCVKCGASMPEQ